jgi:guanylate cyclase
LLAAMAAAMLLSRRTAIKWAMVNVVGFTLVLAMEDFIRLNGPPLPSGFSPINGFLNAVWTSFLAMMLTLYLVKQLEIAHDRADELLFNVLPRPVAARLKADPGTIADSYKNASILFADIVGFTTLSNLLGPKDMINLLNRVYSHFDSLVEHYGVEKIRTIGDNYMVAAGVPVPRPDHAQALANLALDMLAYCKTLDIETGHRLQFRIGINSGPLIAGVIGTRRYQYDIWGDAVNTASRMESHGQPNKAQVTRETYELLKSDFVLVPRGRLEVKGKGEMQTWWLAGRR